MLAPTTPISAKVAAGQSLSAALPVDGDFLAVAFYGATTAGDFKLKVGKAAASMVPFCLGDTASPAAWKSATFGGTAAFTLIPVAGFKFFQLDLGAAQAADVTFEYHFLRSGL